MACTSKPFSEFVVNTFLLKSLSGNFDHLSVELLTRSKVEDLVRHYVIKIENMLIIIIIIIEYQPNYVIDPLEYKWNRQLSFIVSESRLT